MNTISFTSFPTVLQDNRDAIRSICSRLKDTPPTFFRENRYLITALVLASTADAITTVMFMTRHGTEAELHPMIRAAATVLGPLLGPVVGKSCQLAAAFVITAVPKYLSRPILLLTTALYAAAAWHNLIFFWSP